MEFKHPSVQRDDRIVVCFLAVILSIAALLLLALLKPRPVAFDAAAAAAEVASRWLPALRARVERMESSGLALTALRAGGVPLDETAYARRFGLPLRAETPPA
jgi:hypothetical protein